ncbi:MAG: glycosyltransferase family 2 protein [Bacteriovoracaceae bacterium]|jgi:glycosyltransferase involved in cell wall biosynthesis|nr:glycosyltransferase family 2 protein [Bacteriovoracaceae bacterium]
MEKISAIIPCFNEEVNIKDAIESCLFADEIIVVDSFSTDRTVEIIKEYPQVKLLQHEYIHSAAQKNWTIPQATHDWIFLLDADERTTPKLIEEVKKIVAQNPVEVAFWIGRDNYFMDKKLNHVWKGDAVIRLFRKSKCKYEDKHVHAEVLAQGKVGRLQNKLIHDTYKGKGLEAHLVKGMRYTTWAALDRVNKIKKVTLYHLLIKPFFAFLKRYVLQLGVLDGKPGFIISCMGAWNVFIRNVKVWRMHQGEKFPTKLKK